MYKSHIKHERENILLSSLKLTASSAIKRFKVLETVNMPLS